MAEKEKKLKIMSKDKELEFLFSELSDEAQAQYMRANEIAGQIMKLDQQTNELRFLANNYARFVTDEIQKNVDDKEEK